MPRAPKKCGHRDCELRVVGRRYCDQHEAEHQARANTTRRGYGTNHQAARRAALAAFHEGDLCLRCHLPMSRSQALDLDHTDDRSSYLGLAHRRCNARAGALNKTR